MCQSNCSAPIPPWGSPLVIGCDKKGRGTRKERVGHWKMKGLEWLIRAGQVENKLIKRPWQPPTKVMSLEMPGVKGIWPVHISLKSQMNTKFWILIRSWLSSDPVKISVSVLFNSSRSRVKQLRIGYLFVPLRWLDIITLLVLIIYKSKWIVVVECLAR